MIPLLAGALGTVLGLQAMRALFPLILYVLKDRFGQPSPALGGEALAVFATAFVLPRLLRGRGGFVRALVALAALRGALQFWKGDPVGSLVLAAACAPAFLAFLAAPAPDKARGFLLGALLDVAIHAFAGTRDLHWGGVASDLAEAALVAGALATAFAFHRVTRVREPGDPAPAPPPLGLLAWGPFLLLQLELLGNVARHSARTGLPTAFSGTLVAAGFALAFLVVPALARARFLRGGGLPLLGLAFLVPSVLRWDVTGALAPPLLLVAQLAACLLLFRALEPGEDDPSGKRTGRAGVFFGLGSILLLLLLFLHYVSYEMPVGIPRILMLQAAVAALAIAATGARSIPAGRAGFAPPRLLLATLAVVLVPLARGVPTSPPPPRDPGATVVVCFNFHAGFDEHGGWAFDRMLQELRAAQPDVCGLQEVSRGWVINGGADLFELARERLGLNAIHAPSVRADWGSAVFSRVPIASTRSVPLPPPDLPLTRGATLVELSPPTALPRRVIVTHLHHRDFDDAIRDEQARALVAAFPVTSDGLLMGDFNAEPDSETMGILRAAGWVDAAGPPEIARDAPTFPSARPSRRIDAILLGDPAILVSCEVAPAWGSDHRAVIARLRARDGTRDGGERTPRP